MSLNATDLREIKNIVESALTKQSDDDIKPIQGEIEALRNDIAEIYNIIAELQGSVVSDKKFKKLTLEQKLLTLNAELIAAAKQAGIDLPR